MRTLSLCSLTLSISMFCGVPAAQTLKSVSNADNDLQKHKQVIASRLLSWSTGNKEQIDYVSVGRYANYFGFVKMRVSSAHSLKRSEAGRETLSVLTESQRSSLFKQLNAQSPLIKETHSKRLQANDFLNELLNGQRGNQDRQIFIELAKLYAINEAKLGMVLAKGFSEIIGTLTPQQMALLVEIRQKHTSGQAGKVSVNIDELKKLPRGQKQEAFNLAARLLSWTTGNLEDFAYETIGKPSQHFGFVSMRIESNHGVKRGVLANEVVSYLTEDQHAQLVKAAKTDAINLHAYLIVREKFLKSLSSWRQSNVTDNAELHALAAEMALLESQMSWDQAIAMKQILDTFSISQTDQLIQLRNKYVTLQSATGAELYQQCSACHRNSQVAPDLTSIVNRAVAITNYNYSPAMIRFAKKNLVWSTELLSLFLTNPQQYIPGTTMSFKGIDDHASLQSLIEYLNKQ